MDVDLSQEGDRFRAREVIGAVLKPWTISRTLRRDRGDLRRPRRLLGPLPDLPRAGRGGSPLLDRQPDVRGGRAAGDRHLPGARARRWTSARSTACRPPARRCWASTPTRCSPSCSGSATRRSAGCTTRGSSPGRRKSRPLELDRRLPRRLARDARPARRQGRRDRRDDPGARRRPGARRVHDHHRGVRRLPARRGAPRGARGARSTRRSNGSSAPPASGSATRDDPLLGLGALGRPRLDAGDARHGAQPGAQRRGGRGPGSARPSDARFAWDSYRRLLQMFGNVVRGLAGGRVRGRAWPRRATRPGRASTPSSRAEQLRALCERFKRIIADAGDPFPQDPRDQLREAIVAVFESWNGERARSYRRLERIPDDWGTAVNVQRMAFGNRGETSGSGVAFSRNETTGAPEPSGDFLANSQGEDVVAGIRNTEGLDGLREPPARGPRRAARGARDARAPLRRHAGRRVHGRGRQAVPAPDAGRRSARRRPRCASPATRSPRGCSTAREALATIDADALDALLHPTFDPEGELQRARPRRPGLARRGAGRDRLHAPRRPCAAPATART